MLELSDESEKKSLGPSVLAAVVWLALSLYMFVIIPIQLDIQSQLGKPDVMRANMPVLLQYALRFHESRGTALLALVGIVGCGLAYMRRSVRLANVMILAGTVCLIGLVWAVMASLPRN
jgi:hypothetical protein